MPDERRIPPVSLVRFTGKVSSSAEESYKWHTATIAITTKMGIAANRDQERGWRGNDRDELRHDRQGGNERNRNFMIGGRDRSWERQGADYPGSAFSNDRSR